MAGFRAPYHASLSSSSVLDMDRQAPSSQQTTFPYHTHGHGHGHGHGPSHFSSSPHSAFHSIDSPYPPYATKQSMSDFSTTLGHGDPDPESATIDAVNQHHAPDSGEDPPSGRTATLLARLRRLVPNSFYCRLYLLVVLVESTIDVVIEGIIYLKMKDALDGLEAASSTDKQANDLTIKRLPVYLGIFAFAHVYQFILAMFAVHQRNIMQFVFLGLFNMALLTYSVIQISEIRVKSDVVIKEASQQIVKILTSTIPCVISLAQIVYVGLAWKIYQEFGWKVYKLLGADRLVKKMYAHYLFYECLIKFDGFFWVGFSYLALVLSPGDVEYYLTMAMTPGCFLILLVGHLAARHENKWMMISFFLGCLCALIYFTYKLYRIFSLRELPDYIGVWKSHSIFAAISILFLLITFGSGLLVWNNFGKGLKKQMDKADHAKKQAENMGISGHKRTGTVASSYMMNGTNGPKRNNRMSIE
ncbi:Golgi apparatus membrane protein [Rhizoctonia solani]|uniref:Golgi apparatus membrane protein n=1 Tax=Rhizoctonia solani TaxID=456999 RepID=A0A8H8T3Y1_9AGAM